MTDVCREMGVRTNVPFKELTKQEKDIVFHGPAEKKHIFYHAKNSNQAGELDFTYFNAVYTVENALSKVKDEKGMKRVEKFLKEDICPDCHGSGKINVRQQTVFGTMQSTRVCTKCGGKGKVIDTPCPTCSGNGVTQKKVKISVNIPAGIADGQTIRLTGKGNAGANGGPRGDLKVRISVLSDKVFERDGDNIIIEVPLTYTQATLGAEVDIPTIDGPMKYTIPAGTQPGKVFTIKGKGVQHVQRGGRGDQLVKVSIEVPTNLSKKQKDALQAFESTLEDKNYSRRASFFDKLKDLFK